MLLQDAINLSLIAAHIQDNRITSQNLGEELSGIITFYTMQSERDVHEAFIHGRPLRSRGQSQNHEKKAARRLILKTVSKFF